LKILYFIAFLVYSGSLLNLNAQQATVNGIVFNEYNTPLAGVTIRFDGGGTLTDESGYYQLTLPADKEVTLIFSFVGFKRISIPILLNPGERLEFNPILSQNREQISTVTISSEKQYNPILSLSPQLVRKIPAANAGVESILMTLPGINNNNELSTQYAVRGGNYDENLVYINGIEVYRPFLVRSGQQEGLSIINSDLIQKIDFSAGGFQAKYGDKLSSVLDITYRRPVDFAATADLSLLGVQLSAEGISKNKKFTNLTGVRYRNNSLLVDAKQTETNYNPQFTDIQTYLTYQINPKLQVDFLGNVAVNIYEYKPLTRQTNFGTLDNPIALVVNYEGQESDKYETYFSALSASYKPSEKLNIKLIGSAYHTLEQEHFDIYAQYALGTPNSNIGEINAGNVEFTEAIGSQLTHARNNLDALFLNFQIKGQYVDNSKLLEWGLKYTNESVRDRLQEYEIIDSAGFSIRPPLDQFKNEQPYTPYEAPLEAFNTIEAYNDISIDRFSTYLQYSQRFQFRNVKAWYNIGLRSQLWQVHTIDETATQHIISPRAQVSLKPDWKNDMVFRIATGMYQQPPSYRELRDNSGALIPDVKAQKSFHFIVSNEWSFDIWDRPFKLTSDAYYKDLFDVNAYTLENVRIRYRASNDSEAFAYGADFRLTGEFVPGTNSWISIGILKTEENINNRGYKSRPTDQLFKFGLLFQDYVPSIPALKLYINLLYQSGLPGGSPSYVDTYDYQSQLPFYFRADTGFSYSLLKNEASLFKELNVGLEIYNLFDRQNSITNTFVRDAATQQQYAVPNYLTPRVFNISLKTKF